MIARSSCRRARIGAAVLSLLLLVLLLLPGSLVSGRGPSPYVGSPHGASPSYAPAPSASSSSPGKLSPRASEHGASAEVRTVPPGSRPAGWPASLSFPLTRSSLAQFRPKVASAPIGTWGLVGTPADRFGASMAYDPDLGRTVLFGGFDWNGHTYGDTWSYDPANETWAPVPSPTSPEPRGFSTMAYDATDHLLILFGGDTLQGSMDAETWGLTAAGTWENLTPSVVTPFNNPSPREWASLAPSFASGVVLYGGYGYVAGVGEILGDTWSFTLATGWTQLCLYGSCGPTTPGPLFGATMGFDTFGTDDVLFGGDFGPSYTNATWILNSTGWYNLTSLEVPSPGARAFATMALIGGLETVMGGLSTNGGEYSDMWMFTPPTPTTFWSPVSTLPYGGFWMSSAFDSASGHTVLWGEANFSFGMIPNVWGWNGGGWYAEYGPAGSSPPTPDLTEMAYDAADGCVVAFSPGVNGLFPTTWRYQHGAWTNITPTVPTLANSPLSRYGAAMAYDASDGEVILYGGINLPTGQLASDTWAFAGGTWMNITPASSPPPLFFPALAPAFPSGPLVLFGGDDLSYNPTAATWTFLHGVWTSLSPATSPPARYDAAATWDRSEHGALIYGGNGGTVLDDTWRFDLVNDTWVAVCQPSCTGVTVSYPTMTYDPRDNKTILVGGQTGGAFYLSSGAWAVQNTLPAPMPRWLATMTYDANPSDGYALLYGGTGGGQLFADTWTFTPELNLSAPTVNRTSVDATQQSVRVRGGVTGGGAGGDLVSWENLPPGCTGLTGTNFTCVPTVAGNYTIFDQANTTGGVPLASGSVVALTVDPALVLSPAVRSDRAKVDVGSNVTFWANASGGTGTYSDLWGGLRQAVCSGSAESITCHFPVPGTYTVSLTVTDSNGMTLHAAPVTVNVYPVPTVSLPVASPDPAQVGSSLSLSAAAAGGAPPLSEIWNGLPPGCASASTLQLSCTPTSPGSFLVNVTVTDSNSISAVSSSLTLIVLGIPPTLSVTAQASPTSGTAPLGVVFTAVSQGGAPPVVFSWDFGDGSRGVGPTAAHTYGAGGQFVAEVWANDSQGGSAVTSVTVSVSAPPLRAYLVETPRTLTTGESVDWVVQVSGGTAPYSVAWSGLPSGCPTTGTNVSCAPGKAGTYAVSVTVTDHTGVSATASASLVVTGASTNISPASPGLLPWELALLVGGILAGAALLVVGLRRRRPPTSKVPASDAAPAPSVSEKTVEPVAGSSTKAPEPSLPVAPAADPSPPPSPTSSAD